MDQMQTTQQQQSQPVKDGSAQAGKMKITLGVMGGETKVIFVQPGMTAGAFLEAHNRTGREARRKGDVLKKADELHDGDVLIVLPEGVQGGN